MCAVLLLFVVLALMLAGVALFSSRGSPSRGSPSRGSPSRGSPSRELFFESAEQRHRDASDPKKTLETVQGKRYRISVIDSGETSKMGKCVSLDGRMQLCEADEHKYHEMLVHFAIAYLDRATTPLLRVIIVGGGDCLALREVLKYDSVTRVVVVEDEERLPAVCEKHLLVNAHRTDPRVKWLHGDVGQALRRLAESGQDDHLRGYQLALLDCKQRPGASPVTPELCADLLALLSPRGIVACSCLGAGAVLDAKFPFSLPYSVYSDTHDETLPMALHAGFDLRAAAKPDDTPAAKGDVPVSFYDHKKHLSYVPWFLRGGV
jgi:hypothetical protein